MGLILSPSRTRILFERKRCHAWYPMLQTIIWVTIIRTTTMHIMETTVTMEATAIMAWVTMTIMAARLAQISLNCLRTTKVWKRQPRSSAGPSESLSTSTTNWGYGCIAN